MINGSDCYLGYSDSFISQNCILDSFANYFITGHTAKIFHVKWSPIREAILCSGSDDG